MNFVSVAPYRKGVIFRDLAVIAEKLAAEGKTILPLNIGDPLKFDFRTPPHLFEAMVRAGFPRQGGPVAVMLVASYVLYLPFYIGFQSQAGGILPSLAFFTRGVHFWIMFAPFLVPLFAWLFWLWRRRQGPLSERSTIWTGLRLAIGIIAALWLFSWALGLLGVSLPGIGDSMSKSASPFITRLGGFLSYAGGLFTANQGSNDPRERGDSGPSSVTRMASPAVGTRFTCTFASAQQHDRIAPTRLSQIRQRFCHARIWPGSAREGAPCNSGGRGFLNHALQPDTQ